MLTVYFAAHCHTRWWYVF